MMARMRVSIARPIFFLGYFIATWPLAAHPTVEVNLYPDLQMMEDHIRIELWTITDYFPPFADLNFASKELPGFEEVKEKVESYFASKCPLEIDGEIRPPELVELEFDPISEGMHLGLIQDFLMAKMAFRYPVTDPMMVKLKWGIFMDEPDFGWEPISDGTSDPRELRLVFFSWKRRILGEISFTPDHNVYQWRVPWQEALSKEVDAQVATGLAPAESTSVPWSIIPVVLGFLIAGFGMKYFPSKKVQVLLGGSLLAIGGATALVPLGVIGQDAGEIGSSPAPQISSKEAEKIFRERFTRLHAEWEVDASEGDRVKKLTTIAQPPTARKIEAIFLRSFMLSDANGLDGQPEKVPHLELKCDTSDGEIIAEARWKVVGKARHQDREYDLAVQLHHRFTLRWVKGDWKFTDIEPLSDPIRLDPEFLEPILGMPSLDSDLIGPPPQLP